MKIGYGKMFLIEDRYYGKVKLIAHFTQYVTTQQV